MTLLFVFIFGTIIGSFLSAFVYRLLSGEDITKGRSHCDYCGKPVFWYDNIPLFSYLILHGRCRHCRKKIDFIYFLTEFFTGLLFVLIYLSRFSEIVIFNNSILDNHFLIFGNYYILASVITLSVLILIFLTDLKAMIIPDFLVDILTAISFMTVVLSPSSVFYWDFLFSGFIFSLFLLSLNFVTRGAGMGLGDVKLVIALGFFSGLKLGYIFMILSFVIGALVGIFLILIGKAKLGKKIPFGPFIITSFLLVYFFGGLLEQFIFPGL